MTGTGVRLGRISGFELRVHWSTLVIFSILVLSLAGVQLRAAAPGYAAAAYWAAAIATGLVFYLSLLAHEVSHGVLARREGLEVHGLTLWMLGGVASLSGEPRTPAADLRIAGVGPLVSLVLGLAFGVAAAVLDALAVSELVVATLAWLAGINVVLAVFNLIPAAPLDGGRVLRAALWHFRGDRTKAAVAATRAGEAFGYLLAGLGLFRLFMGVWAGSLWFVLLGWFLLNAARVERMQVEARDALGDLRVRDVMTPGPVTVPGEVNVSTLLDDYVMRTRHSAFPLVDGEGKPVGLVTLSQVRGVDPSERGSVAVREVACRRDDVAMVGPDDPVLDAASALNDCADGRVLVVEGGRLVGILTPTDVARALDFGAGRGREREPVPPPF